MRQEIIHNFFVLLDRKNVKQILRKDDKCVYGIVVFYFERAM
jgi:hypothetical protein